MKPLLSCLFFLITFQTFAQKDESLVINLDSLDLPDKTSLPFCSIKIIDARFDQSNVGCVAKTLSFKGTSKNKLLAIFPDSLKNYLPKISKNMVVLNPSSSDTLLMLIKQFRIADHIYNGITKQYKPESILTISCSFYLCREANKLIKMFSIDDRIAEDWHQLYKMGNDDLPAFRSKKVIELIAKLFRNRLWTPSQSAFTLSEVEQGLRKRFQLPAIIDSSLIAGIYKTFEEFKNNSPSITDVQMDMQNDELKGVRDTNNKTISLADFWGACDGKNRYIIFRGELCKLLPSDKSFCFQSYREKNDLQHQPGFENYAPQTGLLPALIIKATDNATQKEIFYLNIDKGEVYLEELFGKSGLTSLQKELLK